MNALRILIADDHEAVRRGLRSLLSSRPDLLLCGEAVDGLDAVDKAKSLQPDVVLMDVSMPRMNGLEATRILRRELPLSKIVIVSQNDPEITRRQAEEVDAAAFVSKSDLGQDLLATLDRFLGNGNSDAAHSLALAPAAPYAAGWLAGGGELGKLIRDCDWSRTPLGPIAGWPQSLKTSVNLMLNSQQPMWIGWGPEITFLYNDAYIPVLSLAKHPHSLGQPASQVWSEIWDICGPLADKVFQKGEATFVDDVRLFMNRGDFLEEVYFSFSYSPIHDETGKVGGLFCPNNDTTAKNLSARRLRTLSELAANALVEKSTEAACASSFATLAKNRDDIPFALLYLTDTAGIDAVLEQTIGVSPDVPRVSPSSVRLDSTSSDLPIWRMNEVLGNCQPQVVLLPHLKSFPLGPAEQTVSEAIVLPVTSSAQDHPIGVLIAGVNPTRKLDAEYRTFFDLVAGQVATVIQNARAAEAERKRVEALAEIDRAKTAFFSNVSHEFRTPLTLMLGPVEDLLARSHTDLPPAAKTQLELVNRNGVRLLRLVNTLLDFSRLEAGRMQAVFQLTDLARFTRELASVFRSATEKAGLALEIVCPTLTEPTYIDRDMWEKIVLNLISNAFKFTFEGAITVALSSVGENVELRVSDTGVGIPAHELPRLFDRFHRIENTRSRTHEGSGIGLALVQELVKLHNGSVRVESTLGQGSAFIVSVPKGNAHLPAESIAATRSLASTAVGAAPFVEEALRWLPDVSHDEAQSELPEGHELVPVPYVPDTCGDGGGAPRPRILVADDNADMRQYLLRLLAERYDVEAVPDGQAALEAARARPPALVLTDVMMPHLDGFALLRELRSDSNTKTIPILLLSARAGEESRVEGLEKGADDYLIKPFSARELLARVRTHLELARVRKESSEAVRESEQRATNIVESIADGFISLDGDWRITYINPRAAQVIEKLVENPQALLGKNFWEAFPETVGTIFEDSYRRAMRDRVTVSFEAFYPEALSRWYDVRAYPARDGLSLYFLDVTERKQAEEELLQKERRLRIATEAAQLGIWLWYPQSDSPNWENERPYEIFDRTPEEGAISAAEFVSRISHPDDVARFEQTFSQALKTGERLLYQGRIFRKDGSLAWIEFTGQTEYAPDGSPLRMLGTVQDITARKRAEERERQITEEAIAATAKFQAVFEQTPVFAGIMALDGTVAAANRLCLDACGYHEEDVLGRPFWDCPWWRKSSEVQNKIRAATRQAAQGIPYREVLTYHWADGTARLVEFALHPIRDQRNQILFLHPTGVDITDLKRAEENYRALAESLDAEVRDRTAELEQRNLEVLAQSEQLRELSHRLMRIQDEERRHIARELHDSAGQILTALGMNLARVAQQAQNGDPQLAKDAEEGQQLVRQLSQEIRTTSYLLHPPLLDESGLTDALLWYIRGLQERSGLEISLDIPEDFGRLSHETELVIFRIVQESLTNVHRHSGSKIADIRISRDAHEVVLEVRDAGAGMPQEKLREIQSRGAGVGIRGMRERVLQCRGEMQIQSAGQGATVLVKIPIRPPGDPDLESDTHDAPAAGQPPR